MLAIMMNAMSAIRLPNEMKSSKPAAKEIAEINFMVLIVNDESIPRESKNETSLGLTKASSDRCIPVAYPVTVTRSIVAKK